MNTNKTILVSTAVVIALALVLAPLAAADDAFAGKKKVNKAKQSISQSQSSSQNSQVVSGGSSVLSGNNINFQFQSNSGNNALAQANN
jgi:hypothetical protein